MDVAGRVGDDRHALVFQRAAGLPGDDGAVRPHGLRDEAAVVREDAGVDVEEVLGVEGRRHQVDRVEREAADDEGGGGVESGKGDALARADGVAGLVAEGVHRLDGLRLPVGDRVGGIRVESEVAADVDVVVVDVALVAEERVGAGDLVRREERREAGEFGLLRREAPGLQVEVERVVVHDVLAKALEALLRAHRADAGEPIEVSPRPEARREDVGEDEGVHERGEDEDLHVRERAGRRFFFKGNRIHGRFQSDSSIPKREGPVPPVSRATASSAWGARARRMHWRC